jgi:hypothetical protein
LKRFATASSSNAANGGETERILPGQQQAKDAPAPEQEEGAAAHKNGNDDDKKLEIDVEEEDEKKVEAVKAA